MIPERQIEVYQQLNDQILQVTTSKRHDYAGADVLSNFKSVSQAASNLNVDVNTPTGYALFMVILKIARLANLLNSGKTPNNESIDDSFLDGINYFKLAYCCHLDNKETNQVG